MDKQKYIDYLNETSAMVSPFLCDLVQQYAELDAELYESIIFFVSRRLGKPLLKPALLRATYELCGGGDWEKVIPACAAFEFINISSYQANSAFDNKLGVLTKKQKDDQFIASMSTRELADECIRRMGDTFDQSILSKVLECLSISNKYIYVAQHWDINLLTLGNKERYADPSYFYTEYVKRCHYGSGVFTGQCAYTGALLAGAGGVDLDAVQRFGESYGTALHMINDLGDYVPADMKGRITREYQDEFSDFRNERLTLPLYLLLHGSGDTREEVAKLIAIKDPQQLHELAALLLESGALASVRASVNTTIAHAIHVLDRFRSRSDPFRVLRAMTSVAKSNKYYACLVTLRKHI